MSDYERYKAQSAGSQQAGAYGPKYSNNHVLLFIFAFIVVGGIVQYWRFQIHVDKVCLSECAEGQVEVRALASDFGSALCLCNGTCTVLHLCRVSLL